MCSLSRASCSHHIGLEGNGREELKTLLSWMMPLFNTNERRDKVNVKDARSC